MSDFFRTGQDFRVSSRYIRLVQVKSVYVKVGNIMRSYFKLG